MYIKLTSNWKRLKAIIIKSINTLLGTPSETAQQANWQTDKTLKHNTTADSADKPLKSISTTYRHPYHIILHKTITKAVVSPEIETLVLSSSPHNVNFHPSLIPLHVGLCTQVLHKSSYKKSMKNDNSREQLWQVTCIKAQDRMTWKLDVGGSCPVPNR